MPLYAYIKIPGIECSESTDLVYNKTWIPLKSFSLSNSAEGRDHLFLRSKAIAKKKKELAANQKASETKSADADESLASLFSALPLPDAAIPAAPHAPEELHVTNEDIYKDDIKLSTKDSKDSGGSMSIAKMIDATSPKLHLKCLECMQYESDQYVDGKIELHICRQVPSKSQALREIYMAYVLQSCLIKDLRINASENSKLEETFTITFEKIHSCVRLEGKNWDVAGWNYQTEKEDTSVQTPSGGASKTFSEDATD